MIYPNITNDNLFIQENGETIASINRNDLMDPFLGKPVVKGDKIKLFMEKLSEKVLQSPENARINKREEIVPGKVGYQLSQEKFRTSLYEYLFEQHSKTIEVPKMKVYPKVDSELLASVRSHQIGHYVTYFNHRNKERSHNIHLASKAIDSYVLFPKETFSFNEVVGKRTKQKGYMPAPVIVKGEVTEGIGGGICQVSSTLFNAVDNAGVDIGQRYSHSKRVPYVPEGRDATVSWYGPDFTFTNPYNHPLLLRSKVKGGQLMITIHSANGINVKSREIPKAKTGLPKELNVR